MSPVPSAPRSSVRVAVLGAGASGLPATREFADAGYETHTYEATSNVGGLWNYSPTPTRSSAVYNSLSCNIPHQVMCYTDFPFPDGSPSYPSHRAVLEYLRSYTAEHRLDRHIRFNSRVTDLRKHNGMWRVSTASSSELYHAVVLCVGHFSVPRDWSPPGFEHLAANGVDLIHSSSYREPSSYAGRDVLIIGAGPSGVDISVEISKVARSVVLAHSDSRKIFPYHPPANLREVTRPSRVLPDGSIELVDGTTVQCESIVLCNGYTLTFPFMHDLREAGVEIRPQSQGIHGLAALCVPPAEPTIAFIGIPVSVVPFPMFEDQAGFFRAVLEGKVSQERLAKWAQDDEEYIRVECGGDAHKAIKLGARQWEYRRRLACAAGRPMVAPSVVEMYNDSSDMRYADPLNFRRVAYHMLGRGPGEWRVTLDGEDITGLPAGDVFAEQAKMK